MAARNAISKTQLLGGSALALVGILAGGPGAVALNECGSGTTVTCTPAGNTFPNGIQYKVTDLTIVVEDGVIVDTTTKAGEAAGIASGGPGSYGDLVLKVGSSAGGVIITTDEDTAEGIESATDGSIAVTSFADITTTGINSFGILATGDDEIVVTSHGDIRTAGAASAGIFANSVNSYAKIDVTGDIVTTGNNSIGLRAAAMNAGAASITFADGDISTQGKLSSAIDAYSKTGKVSVSVDGDLATVGDLASGIHAQSSTGNIVIVQSGAITTQGQDSDGIYAKTNGGIDIDANGDISTTGDLADAISANLKLTVEIDAKGNLSTAGVGAHGIYARSTQYQAIIRSRGGIVTTGDASFGINVQSRLSTEVRSYSAIVTSGDNALGIFDESKEASATVRAYGAIHTSGKEANGVQAIGKYYAVVRVGDVITSGLDANGIYARAGNKNATIYVFGEVAGGAGDESAGIRITAAQDSTLTIQSGGSVGALTDIAIVDSNERLNITNRGNITGNFSLGDTEDLVDNLAGASVDLRNFADIDGDGIRETEGVAIADFGKGADVVNNVGTLRLAAADDASKVVTTGQIIHPGGGNADITQEGVEQAHIVNLELFANSGLVTMQDGVAGDLLAITDAASVGAGGGGEFRSEGGRLALDTVLDDGSSKQTDILVLDKATTGTGGATRVLIANAGGAGGRTTGDGIQIINIDGTSTADAFVLGNHPVAGAFQYDLFFQNQAKTDQNWYLRSSLFESALEYPAITTGALSTWYTDLGGLHDRLGERRAQVEDGQTAELPSATDVADTSPVRVNSSANGGWFKVSGADMDIEQDGPADFDLNSVRAEGGVDVGFHDLFDTGDWLVLGALAGYGQSSIGFEGDAQIDFDIATVGAYATYFRGPYYLDALVKLDWLDGDFTSEAVSDDGDVALPVFGLSLETGYRFDLMAHSNWGALYVQPQAQLSYAHAGDDSFRDDSGSRIALEDADSLRGRLGARLGQELNSDSGAAKGNFYLEASVNQEFLGQTEAKVTGITLEQELPDTTFEVGGGFDIALPKDGVTFTVGADYTFGEEADGIGATGGIRINW